jgi:hypothetical protein
MFLIFHAFALRELIPWNVCWTVFDKLSVFVFAMTVNVGDIAIHL